ncbi:hypothetical protein JCM1841_002270 [Sporobolomyces salmonicolor]
MPLATARLLLAAASIAILASPSSRIPQSSMFRSAQIVQLVLLVVGGSSRAQKRPPPPLRSQILLPSRGRRRSAHTLLRPPTSCRARPALVRAHPPHVPLGIASRSLRFSNDLQQRARER